MGPPAAARLHSAIGYITPGAIFRESESLADPITLQRSMILFPSPIIEANARFKYSNLPTSGVVSLLAVTRAGQQVEAGMIGREGVIGAWIGMEGARSFGQATVQIDGAGWRLGAAPFLALYAAVARGS
jgi:hypothetical protein